MGQGCDAGDVELTGRVCLPGVEEVQAGVGAHRPVVVLPGAVDAGEGLLVEEHVEAELRRLLFADLHEEHVVVGGEGGLAVDGGHLVLGRGDLVVQHRHRDAEPEHDGLDVEEQLVHGARHRRKVVEVPLLVAGRQSAEERAAGVHEVGAGAVVLGLDDEELLLPAEEGVDGLGVGGDLDCLQEPQALPGHGVVGPQQGRLLVDAGTEVCDEGARDAQDLVQDVAGRRPVPGGERRGRMSRAQAAVRERRAVGLAEEEPLVGQRGHEGLRRQRGAPIEVDQRVRLDRTEHASNGARAAAHREEPVREGHGALAAGPLEDGLRDHLHVVLARVLAGHEGLPEAPVHAAGEQRLHRCVVQDAGGHVGQLIRRRRLVPQLVHHRGAGGGAEHCWVRTEAVLGGDGMGPSVAIERKP
mmetsp:Transcript_63588/g.166544  ORF Transcript_63588/g.166544 Transcript_63588/m.166544 type:complete len:413 (-) Transcript_63588:22-1260(-)